jgi:hypothetical protein
MTREQILKKGGFPNTSEGIKAFYKKYNTPEKFFAEHGGSLSGAPHDGQPTADQFFSYGAPALGHMNIPMSNPTYLAHGGMYHSDGPFYHAEPGMIINPTPPKATPVPAMDADMYEKNVLAPKDQAYTQDLINKAKKQQEWDEAHPWTPSAGTTPEGGKLFHKTGQSGTPQDYFYNTKSGAYYPYNPTPVVVKQRYGGFQDNSVAEYCWGGLPGGANEMPRMDYGGYMDMGGYNSPTNYGSFSVPMKNGGSLKKYQDVGEVINPEMKAFLEQRNQSNINKMPSRTTDYEAKGTDFSRLYPNKDNFDLRVENQKFPTDSVVNIPNNPQLQAAYRNGKFTIAGSTPAGIKQAAAINAGNLKQGKDKMVYADYSNLYKQEYGGILDASNNQDYPMMDEGGMESMSKGNIIKMLKQAAKQRKKAYREGGNTSMQGGNANNIPQQEKDNFINGVSNLYNNYMVDQETEYVANQLNAMDQEMMPMANMGMQSYNMSPQISQYQNYISNLENQNQSAFGNMLNSATNLAATLPRSQNPLEGAPDVSDITKASEPVKAQRGRNMMPEFKLTDKSQDVYKGIQDINRRRAEEEQRKSYENQTDDVEHLTNEDIKRRSYQNWNNSYNSGSQDPNKPWWEQPYRFGFNDPRGFAGMFPDTYYKTSTKGSRTLKEAKDRNLPFTSMEATYGAGAKAAANIGKLFGKDPNKTLTKFSPKKLRYYFGQPGTQQSSTQQPGTQQPANTQAATNSLYNPMTAEQAANPYGQIPAGTTQAPAPYLPASVAPGYDASGRLLNPPQSLPGTNLFNMNAQLKEYTGRPLDKNIKQSRVEKLMNPFSADAQRQLDVMRGTPYTGKAPGVFYNKPAETPYGFMENVEADQSPMRAYGGMPMAQWGFANPVDMTMLGISNTKPELYVDAKLKKDYSAAAPFASGFISNLAQGINIPNNQEAIKEAKDIVYNSAGRYAQSKTGNKGLDEINTQASMLDKSMDSPYQTSAYSSIIGEYGGSFDDGGAYEEGEEYELSDDQIRALEEQGYVLKY